MHPIRHILGTVCDHCPMCNYARKHPDTLVGKYYQWHGSWCPAWQAQQEIAAAREQPAAGAPAPSSDSAAPDASTVDP